MLQKTALKVLKSGQNVFLTGSAGAGKTYLLNQYIQYLRERGVPLAITASTGIAATHLGGQTIHSWSGLGIKDDIIDSDLEKIARKKPVRDRITKTQVLIIDEISMLSAQNLYCVDKILKFFKVNSAPFGGIQVIFSGDFFQLPPVSKSRIPSHLKFGFMSPVWVEADLKVCYITESFRQSDGSLLKFLNEMRSGEVSDSGQDLLREKLEAAQHTRDENAIKLYTHNLDVDEVNEAALERIDAKLQYYKADTVGSGTVIEALKKSVMAPQHLRLKIGAHVMFVKNNPECGYMNGTLGQVTDFTVEDLPVVETLDGNTLVVKAMDWNVMDEKGKPIATYTQIPLRLAWAITVHKSQGMTLDSAEMDLSKTFEPGQGYVALSRVKSWEGLTLLGCNNLALQMDPLVMKADKRFQELTEEVEEVFNRLEMQKLNKIFDQFVFRCGGNIKKN